MDRPEAATRTSRDDLEARFSTRRARLRAVWLVVPLFLWLVRPSPFHLTIGASLGVLGLAIRGWAAGTIRKGEELTITGPYAHTRHPLYLGSLFLGLGITVASGYLIWTLAFALFYLAIYARTMRGEAVLLETVYGEEYRAYAARVPSLLPRLIPNRAVHRREDDPGHGRPPGTGFTWARYRRNREWEAVAGFLAVMGYLVVRWWLTA